MRRTSTLSMLACLAVCLACGPDTIGDGTSTDASATATDGPETGSATATGTDTTGTETGSGALECEPILQGDDSPSGFERCEEIGAIFRASAESCVDPTPPSTAVNCNLMYGVCASDEDCTDQPYGSCQANGDVVITCACSYGCMSDADCSEGSACVCSPLQGGTICVDAECRTDDDCPGDQRCGLSPDLPPPAGFFYPTPSLHCRTAEDSCAGDVDCGEAGLCRFDDGAWSCWE